MFRGLAKLLLERKTEEEDQVKKKLNNASDNPTDAATAYASTFDKKTDAGATRALKAEQMLNWIREKRDAESP